MKSIFGIRTTGTKPSRGVYRDLSRHRVDTGFQITSLNFSTVRSEDAQGETPVDPPKEAYLIIFGRIYMRVSMIT